MVYGERPFSSAAYLSPIIVADRLLGFIQDTVNLSMHSIVGHCEGILACPRGLVHNCRVAGALMEDFKLVEVGWYPSPPLHFQIQNRKKRPSQSTLERPFVAW